MKKILILISVVAFGFGCDKIEIKEPIAANGGTTAIKFSIQTPNSKYPKISYTPNGSAAEYLSLSYNDIKVKFEAPTVATQDIYLEYKTNPAGLTKLNADEKAKDPSYKPFALLPDSCFSIVVTKDTIRKGLQYAEKVDNNIVVYTQKIDPSINYMLPLTVTTGAYPTAVGTGTIYYYIIGNPLAGPYDAEGYFYHPSAPRAFTRTGSSGALSPVTDKTLVTELGDLGGSGYYAILAVPDPYATTIQPVTITVYPGSISPVYQWDAGLPTTGTPNYVPVAAPVWGKSALCNNTYNPATKTFYLRYGYLGGTGWRVTEEIIKKK